MFNYSFVLPSTMILFVLLGFFFARRRLPIRLNHTFLELLAIQMWVTFFDIISSKADDNFARHSVPGLYALNCAFFVVFFLRILWFYRFTLDLLNIDRRSRWVRLSRIPFWLCEAACLSSFFTGAVFSIGENGYRSGPFYNLLYLCFLFYLILSLALLLIHARDLRRNILAGGVVYNLILVAGNVARFAFPTYLVMGTFCMLAILVLYLAFMNPDLYVTERGPAFNMRGFRLVLREQVQGRDYRLLGFALQNYNRERSILGGDQMDMGITLINQFLAETFPHQIPFYLRGGRFALLGTGTADWNGIQQRITERFQRPWRAGTADLYLNAAFATVRPEANLDTAERVITNLLLALENAEHMARTDAAVDVQELDRQVDILHVLEKALDEDRVEVFLQPVVDSHTRRVVAAEALARLRDGNGEIIPPGLFIPIAERNGHINRLGEQVFEKTCAFIRDHDIAAMGLKWINVNLSPIQCTQRDLAARFSAILERCGVDAGQVHLEVTEQSMVDYSYLRRQIEALRDRGFRFVLDDFGSGYSNLTRVKHYPFINIKLDMEVVWDYFHDRDSLLPTIIEGFRRMNLSVTAEGIETEEMADALTGIGSDFLQGYLFSKPLPMEDFLRIYGG